MHEAVKGILASIIIFNKASKTYEFLDKEDVRENKFRVAKWIKRYEKEETFDLGLVKKVVSLDEVTFYDDLVSMENEIPGNESNLVLLQEVSQTKPARAGAGLNNLLGAYDKDYMLSGMQEAFNKAFDRKSQALDNPSLISSVIANLSKYRDIVTETSDGMMDVSDIKGDREKEVIEGAPLSNILWPLSRLNDTIGCLRAKSLNFIAAPQGSYKTKFMVQMIADAIIAGKNAVYVTAEMSTEEIIGHIVFSIMGKSEEFKTIQDGRFYGQAVVASQSGSLKVASKRCPELYQYIKEALSSGDDGLGFLKVMDTTSTSKLEDIIVRLERLDEEISRKAMNVNERLDVVFLDYLGIFDVPDAIRKKNQEEKGEYLAGVCKKRLALSFAGRGIPVVSAHQINREGQKRTDKVGGGQIKSYDLAGSGWIERYADTIVTLQRNGSGGVIVQTVKSRRTEDVQAYECIFDPLSLSVIEKSAVSNAMFQVDLVLGG